MRVDAWWTEKPQPEQAMDIRMFKYEGPIQALIVSEREYGEARDIRMSKYEGPIQALIASERE